MSDSPTVSFVPLKVGTKAGPYRIVRELGIGGMGQVFLAEDTRLDRQVALKFLSHDLAQKDDFRQRFMREAKAAAKLNHYNIVTIHDVGEALQRIYIAMEYVEGRTLRQMIDTRALSFDQSIDVFTQLCQGLKKAHSAGIIHRDLKPANIMVTAEGQVKILDFGLAKVVMSGDLTNTNAALGTVNYMSPEQAQGAEVDQRSDLFSSGILLFEMLAGVNPFVRGHMPATIHAITYEPLTSRTTARPLSIKPWASDRKIDTRLWTNSWTILNGSIRGKRLLPPSWLSPIFRVRKHHRWPCFSSATSAVKKTNTCVTALPRIS